jgi:Tfp pilus assembly protein PilV
MEVLISALLIAISMGSILTMNIQSIDTLRASHEAAATSQVLQQRVEMIRKKTWAEISSSTGVAAVMRTGTQSEIELADSHMSETMKVSAPQSTAGGPAASTNFFVVRRAENAVEIVQAGDFAQEPTLFFEGTITWRDRSGVHQRMLRSIICRAGLTRAGLYGSVLGRPGSTSPAGP